MSVRWFYRFEAKGIQNWILSTGRLREILGASAIIESLVDRRGLLSRVLEASDPDGRVVYSAAGGATLAFGSDRGLQAFARRWAFEVARLAPGLPIVQAWVPGDTPPDDVAGALAVGLAAARNSIPPHGPGMGPVLVKAPRSGRPAVAGVRDRDGNLQDAGALARDEAATRFADRVRANFGVDAPEGMQWTDDLGKLAGGDGQYLAVVHADGNGLGTIVPTLSLEELPEFSRALADAARRAARRATHEALFVRETNEERLVPGRPIVLGGDDLTAILKAERALAFVQAFCRAFGEETEKADAIPGRLTATAGVAFVRDTHPFIHAYKRAAALGADPKLHGRVLAGEAVPPSLLAFQRVTSSLHASPAEHARLLGPDGAPRVLRDGAGDKPMRLTAGPWLLEPEATDQLASAGILRLGALRDLAVALRRDDLPVGTFREVARLLEVDPDVARERLRRVVVVQRDRATKGWVRLVEQLRTIGLPDDSPLWFDGQRLAQGSSLTPQALTPWLDALALARLDRPDPLDRKPARRSLS